MMTDNYLFITEVGSRMWGMATPSSDYDLFHVFQQPSSEYLRGSTFEKTRAAKSYFENTKEIDAQYMEIGHLVNLLKKGNVNAIWSVCSPIIHKDSEWLSKLRDIVTDNLSKSSYASINGMAHSQLNDAIKRASVKDPLKSKATTMRTLQFGVTMLMNHKIEFKPPEDEITNENIGKWFRYLDLAKEKSMLPDEVDPKPFEDFLYDIRMSEIFDGFRAKVGVR
jgi:predicted nucleotidyltransferase